MRHNYNIGTVSVNETRSICLDIFFIIVGRTKLYEWIVLIRVYKIIETIYLKQRLKSGPLPTMLFYCIHTGHFIVNLPKRLKLDNTQVADSPLSENFMSILSRYPSELYVYTHIQICKRCKFHICINRA